MSKKTIVIVGGVAGGASAAARLRRLDEQAEIILFEKGEYISFANCGLPYYIGGEITDKSVLTLQTPESFHARFRVDVRVQQEVTSISPEEKTVWVKNYKTGQSYGQRYDKLILSPGASPIRPAFLQSLGDGRVFTLRNIPDTYRIDDFIRNHSPKSAVVIGGGYIGVEMAENLVRRGLSVTMIEMQQQLIAPLDPEMSAIVQNHVRTKGVNLKLGVALQQAEQDENGLTMQLSDGSSLKTDFMLLSIGVAPDSALARQAGLAVNARGAILVDDKMQTSAADVYAVGDAVEVVDFVTGDKAMIPLAGPANKQGRIVADQICGIDSRYTGTQGSAVLKVFDLTVATTGLNEKQAKAKGLDFDRVHTLSASHASYYPGAENMFVKTLFAPKTGKILGAQIVGQQGADKRCDVLATVIRLGGTAEDLTRLELCYAPPFSSAKDPVNMAGFVIENIRAGRLSEFQWDEVAGLPRDGSITLLDTRTAEEFAAGSIEGFRNIPLDELREHLDELDRQKPIYLTCQIGLRGYLACRILCQSGFDCHNLSGGYSLYHQIFGDGKTAGNPACVNPELQR